MNKILISLFSLLLLSSPSGAQVPDEGALQIDNGFLVYVRNPRGVSYTLELRGDIGIADFPLILDNGNFYLISFAPKEPFGNDDNNRLQRFMSMQINKLNEQYGVKNFPKSMIKNVSGTLFNVWKYSKPNVDTSDGERKVVATYYLDFVKDGTLFRIEFPSTSHDDSQARATMYSVFRKMRFYNSLDIPRLQDHIAQGLTYYRE